MYHKSNHFLLLLSPFMMLELLHILLMAAGKENVDAHLLWTGVKDNSLREHQSLTEYVLLTKSIIQQDESPTIATTGSLVSCDGIPPGICLPYNQGSFLPSSAPYFFCVYILQFIFSHSQENFILNKTNHCIYTIAPYGAPLHRITFNTFW